MTHDRPRRKTIRMDHAAYGIEGIVYHITICTAGGRRVFADEALAGEVLGNLLTGPVSMESDLYAICLMPNHVHLLIGVRQTNLIALIGRWKTYTTNLAHKRGVVGDIWQRSFYDHALKAEEHVVETAAYITGNPVRAGLVDDATVYRFSWHRWMRDETHGP